MPTTRIHSTYQDSICLPYRVLVQYRQGMVRPIRDGTYYYGKPCSRPMVEKEQDKAPSFFLNHWMALRITTQKIKNQSNLCPCYRPYRLPYSSTNCLSQTYGHFLSYSFSFFICQDPCHQPPSSLILFHPPYSNPFLNHVSSLSIFNYISFLGFTSWWDGGCPSHSIHSYEKMGSERGWDSEIHPHGERKRKERMEGKMKKRKN